MGTNKNYRTHRHGYKANTGNGINYIPPVMPSATRRLSPLHRAELIEEISIPPILGQGYHTEFDYWHILRRPLTDPMDGTDAKKDWEKQNPDYCLAVTLNPPWIFAYLDTAVVVWPDFIGAPMMDWIEARSINRWKTNREHADETPF